MYCSRNPTGNQRNHTKATSDEASLHASTRKLLPPRMNNQTEECTHHSKVSRRHQSISTLNDRNRLYEKKIKKPPPRPRARAYRETPRIPESSSPGKRPHRKSRGRIKRKTINTQKHTEIQSVIEAIDGLTIVALGLFRELGQVDIAFSLLLQSHDVCPP